MYEDIRENPEQPEIWKRGFFMLVFIVVYYIAKIVIFGVAFLQFGFALFTGRANEDLSHFGQQLSTFVYHIYRFLTFSSEYKPFPFDTWANMHEDETTRPKELSNKEDE